jgi:hypothetical protein
MGILAVRENADERGASGKFREAVTYTRSWTIKVDSPGTSVAAIAQAAGVSFGSPHPDDSSVFAMEFDVKPRGDSLLLYGLTVRYYTPKRDGDTDPTALPPDVWTGGSSVSSGPCWKDITGEPITNSAGVALPDLTMEIAEFSCSLTRCFADFSGISALRNYTNKINSDSFLGCPPKTWKCQGGRFAKKTEGAPGQQFSYWEVTFDFAYREDTWVLKPLDIGYSQKVDVEGMPTASGDYLAAILGQDKRPIKEPVALAQGVGVLGPAPGYPQVINGGQGANPYAEASFSWFGGIS